MFAPAADEAEGDSSRSGIEKRSAAGPKNAGLLAARLGTLQSYFDEALRPLQAAADGAAAT